MSLHKTRQDGSRPDPTQPGSTVLANGRHAIPHAMIDGKPILGGLQNARVDGTARTPEENKLHNEQYHQNRENMKKSQAKSFNTNTGEPKTEKVVLKPDPVGDGSSNAPAPADEVKKNTEVEKKLDNTIEKKPDVKPVGPAVPPPAKVEEKK